MYSIDYPFVSLCFPFFSYVVDTFSPPFFNVLKEIISDGATWINSLTSVLTKQNLDSLRREVTIKLSQYLLQYGRDNLLPSRAFQVS